MTPDKDKVEAALARLYARAYGKGHHDTVEGGYVDVHYSDLDTYFADNETVQEALSVLTEALAERGWRPIESAPRDGTNIVCFWPDRCGNCPANPCGMAVAWFENGAWLSGRLLGGIDVQLNHKPTHWRPLPEPPKETP